MTTNVLPAASIPMMRGNTIPNRWWAASAAVLGGGMIAAGTLLPWLSFFAGLHPVRGVAGLNGRFLLAAGLGITIAGAASVAWGGYRFRRVIGGVGMLLTGICLVLLVRLFLAHEQLAANPMMVARIGPGLFLSTIGAVIVAGALLRAGGREAA